MVAKANQTESFSSQLLGTVDPMLMSSFLQKVGPIMERELELGVTPFRELTYDDDILSLNVTHHQTISLEDRLKFFDNQSATATATWLSIASNNASSFAISLTLGHPEQWCNHDLPKVYIFTPKMVDSRMAFVEQKSAISVRSCITAMATNTEDRDIFAGGTVLGDVYVWALDRLGQTKELCFETTANGEVRQMTWLVGTLITCHTDGQINAWKLYPDNCRLDKSYRIFLNAHELVTITAVAEYSGKLFCAGSDCGLVALCNINQSTPVRGRKDIFNPTVMEHELPGKEAIKLIECVTKDEQRKIMIGTEIGEIFLFEINDHTTELNLVFRAPQPFRSHFTIMRNCYWIICPEPDGRLTIYNVETGESKTIIGAVGDPQNNHHNLIQLSNNGQWALTGLVNENIQLFSVELK